jgi:DNA-directed RNA polymerase subunit RPC12/RpoP
MAHKRRRQRQKFECTHRGFGKFCHRCKDEAAGRIKPKKVVQQVQSVDATGAATVSAATDAPKKYWKRAKCPYCGGNRVKKNEINVFSDNNAKEYRCTSYECGKEFNSEHVKEYEQVEVVDRPKVPYNPRLTD